VTCYRLGLRLNQPDMPALFVRHGRPGFYFRVIEEGEVAAGDDISQVASGPERMSVRETNALLYLPGHPRDQLQRALRITALSTGWRHSFEALLTAQLSDSPAIGNAGLHNESGPVPARQGFRPLRVLRKVRESIDVTSLVLEPADGKPLDPALAGQFLVLRLGPAAAPMLRSYSLSGEPGTAQCRVSIKREAHGAAGAYVADKLQVGDIVQASAARGDFTLRLDDTPVVLISAGIGLTPVLAMLHALAAERSTRQIWWVHGARNGREHPFAEEVRGLMTALPRGHSYVCYSSPDPADRLAVDFDLVGRLNAEVLRSAGVPGDGEFYICGPSTFMRDMTTGLQKSGVAPDHIHTEAFGAGPSVTPGIAASSHPPPHLPTGPAGSGALVSFARSGLNVRWGSTFHSLLELAEACDVPVRWACRSGVCHTCESGLVAGEIAYQPDPTDAPADGNVLICCAQPRGDVVIDL